ncbi:S-adenosylmethionine:tRNA ribosyltransferase-isomerase [Pseudonocardia sp. CA-107938]|uniref:S-adenosylmethionine:tRNA ribosyltransferase-isomerase n=1 Tax=Pseudonocardia sp. CA-107938 TaxID=3240021 RepID=UPI003D8A00EC
MTTTFVLDPALSASEPPEQRGLPRDGVRLLVADGQIRHRRFTDLPAVLSPGDLVVVNHSDTEPAAVDGARADGRPVTVHVSGPARATPGAYVVELRDPAHGRVGDGRRGERVRLPHGVVATLVAAFPDADVEFGSRLWVAELPVDGGVPAWLRVAGRPIRYAYLRGDRPLADHRTVFARPDGGFGSAEMPSAGRPFSSRVLAGLAVAGVGLATLTLHTGVASLEAGELPLPERFRVPAATAAAVNATRAAGGRIVAVGTTVTRALETVAAPDGNVRAGSGWTDLVLGPERPARTVDGLITGWHEPDASHLLLLEAVAGRSLVERAYAAALAERYLWHEFGDACVLLPGERQGH